MVYKLFYLLNWQGEEDLKINQELSAGLASSGQFATLLTAGLTIHSNFAAVGILYEKIKMLKIF